MTKSVLELPTQFDLFHGKFIISHHFFCYRNSIPYFTVLTLPGLRHKVNDTDKGYTNQVNIHTARKKIR